MSILDENWDYTINLDDVENQSNIEFNTKVSEWQELIAMKLEKAFKTQRTNSSNMNENQDYELRELTNKNQELRQQIDKELLDISQSQQQYETYKKDQELLSREIKDTHESFLMAKKMYKKYLNIYYTIESKDDEKQIIFLQFFTESKKESEKYSVRLLRWIGKGDVKYEIASTTPRLDSLPEIQKKLQETNDVPGALCAVRETFLNMRTHKK